MQNDGYRMKTHRLRAGVFLSKLEIVTGVEVGKTAGAALGEAAPEPPDPERHVTVRRMPFPLPGLTSSGKR